VAQAEGSSAAATTESTSAADGLAQIRHGGQFKDPGAIGGLEAGEHSSRQRVMFEGGEKQPALVVEVVVGERAGDVGVACDVGHRCGPKPVAARPVSDGVFRTENPRIR
jgi:hypothetical protein